MVFPFQRKAPLHYPTGRAPRTAVLVPWFRARDRVRIFPGGWSHQAARFAPEAIAATREQLLDLALAPPRSLTHALICLARPGDSLLTQAVRNTLWDAFGVPVFEQIVDEKGALLAAECEAHDGLHVLGTISDLSPYSVETSACDCGLPGIRLSAQVHTRQVHQVAAYAR